MLETNPASQRWLEEIDSRLGSGYWRDRNEVDTVVDNDPSWYATKMDRTGDHKDVSVQAAEQKGWTNDEIMTTMGAMIWQRCPWAAFMPHVLAPCLGSMSASQHTASGVNLPHICGRDGQLTVINGPWTLSS